MKVINVAPFAPDNAVLSNSNSEYIKNVFADIDSYVPVPGMVNLSDAKLDDVLASIVYKDFTGRVLVFAGTSTKLYLLDILTHQWKEIGEEKVLYSANRDVPWSFALFGNSVIAVNANDKPLVYEIGLSKTFKPLAEDKKIAPPRAGMVRVWGDFLVFMQLPEHPNRIHWSGLNDINHWEVGKKSCDYQDFPDGGSVKNSSNYINPIIFMDYAIYYGQFLPGSQIIFSFKKLADNKGIKFAESVVGTGPKVYFLSKSGFCLVNETGQIIPIGYGYVDKYIINKLKNNFDAKIIGSLDNISQKVYWAIAYEGKGQFSEILVYDMLLQKWTSIQADMSWFMPIYSLSHTLESLDTICDDINKFPYSFDDKRWMGGTEYIGGIDRKGRLFGFMGSSMPAIIESQEFMVSKCNYQRLRYVFPLMKGLDYAIKIGKRNTLEEEVIWSKALEPSPRSGKVLANVRAKYIRLRLEIKSGVNWEILKGFSIELSASGKE